jgi:O-antigen/teichoic acid export membrane protein
MWHAIYVKVAGKKKLSHLDGTSLVVHGLLLCGSLMSFINVAPTTSVSENVTHSPPRTAPVLLARNAILSLGAEILISIVLVATVPTLVHRLGPASFGLYSLAFALIGYLSYLDLGVSRAATQFVSAGLARNDEAGSKRVVHSATFVNLLIGLLCGLAVLLVAPLLIHTVFKITPALEKEARLVFYAVALAVPVYLVQGVFRAVLMSYQRFGVISVINGVSTSLQLLIALVLAWMGFAVGVIVLSSVAIRVVAAGAYAGFLLRLMPGLVRQLDLDRHEFGALLHFGGWVTVSQLILQLLVYLDRFLLASFLSLDAVTLYSVPYESISRFRIIPASLMATLYPAMSEHHGGTAQGSLQALYNTSMRYLLLLMLPGISFLVVFGRDLLSLWMGAGFALKASVVFETLAIGFLLGSLAYVSYSAIQAFRKPDVVGKFHLFILPFYMGLSVVLVRRWGITGAAVAATLRSGLDAVLLFWVAQKHCGCSVRSAWNSGMSRVFSFGLLLTFLLLVVKSVVPTPWVRLVMGSLVVIAYFFTVWRHALSAREKPAIVSALNVFRRQATV